MMESVVERQYRDYTRYLKPLRLVGFSDLEMMQSLMQCVDPEDVASVAQLLGHRRGVIRITLKTSSGVERLEQAVQRRRLAIGDVPLGLVDDGGQFQWSVLVIWWSFLVIDGGQFIVVTLDNVPHYIPDEQVEQEMSMYGAVAGCSKDFIEVRGCRIENERRNVLFTALVNKHAVINNELDMFGTTVYSRAPYLDPDTQPAAAAATSAKGTNSAESDPRPHHPPVPASHPAPTKRASGSVRPAAVGNKRSSMYHQMSVAGLESPEALAAPAASVGDIKDPGSAYDHPAPAEKALGRAGSTPTSVPVQGRPTGGGMDMSRQMAKRTEAFEQLSALLQ